MTTLSDYRELSLEEYRTEVRDQLHEWSNTHLCDLFSNFGSVFCDGYYGDGLHRPDFKDTLLARLADAHDPLLQAVYDLKKEINKIQAG